jgi:hypothetical protein
VHPPAVSMPWPRRAGNGLTVATMVACRSHLQLGLPRLQSCRLMMGTAGSEALFLEGKLDRMEDVQAVVGCGRACFEMEALSLLPALESLTLEWATDSPLPESQGRGRPVQAPQLVAPPLPSSVKKLNLTFGKDIGPKLGWIEVPNLHLRDLMERRGHAPLQSLQVSEIPDFLPEALLVCSPTLKELIIRPGLSRRINVDGQLLAALVSCKRLERLVIPSHFFIHPLGPEATWTDLRMLELWNYPGVGAHMAPERGLWDLMARGASLRSRSSVWTAAPAFGPTRTMDL